MVPKTTENWLRFSARLEEGALRADSLRLVCHLLTEVCFADDCSSLGTFSTRFTELVGVPPSVYRRRAARDGGDALVRGETGDQTDQESRSEGTGPRVDFFLPDG